MKYIVALLMLAVAVSAQWYPYYPHQFQADSADVALAKAEHYAAFIAAAGRAGASVPSVYYNIPNPVQDTPEVQAAKAEFFRAYAEAAARAAIQPENEQ